ncbi:hypothetical protein ACQ5TV_13450 [Acetobacter ghanensis]
MSANADQPTPDELKRMTATIVKGFLAGNPMDLKKLPALIKLVDFH